MPVVKNLIRNAIGRRRAWLNLKILKFVYRSLRALPRRLSFLVVVIFAALSLRGRSAMETAFAPLVVRALDKNPESRFSSWFSRRFPSTEISVLNAVGAHREVVDLLTKRGSVAKEKSFAGIMARSLFELGEFERARKVISVALSRSELVLDPGLTHFKGLLDITCGDIESAKAHIAIAGRFMPHITRPHHNLAARLGGAYAPNNLDDQADDLGRLYDAANFIGQRVIHVGRGELSPEIYGLALTAQKELAAKELPSVSKELRKVLRRCNLLDSAFRIMPEEWCTQIGHLGLLEALFRMRTLGWWDGEAVVTTQPGYVANNAFLRLLEPQAKVLIKGIDVPNAVAEEMASLQRWVGLTFNAFELPDGRVVPWLDAGAIMMREWERQGRSYPARERFDELYGPHSEVDNAAISIKARWGMKEGDWYVCLHLRDGSHYGELSGTGQAHRNAGVEQYLEAIRYVTSLGGWVVKLGGPNSPRLPKMARVIDYARSTDRSEIMDLHLIRHARCFIGTTSGLTNAVMSLGVPAALVNCITTDAQLWSSNVRFCLKWIKLRDGTPLNQLQLTSTPWRWRMFSAELLGRYGARIEDNTEKEILETVKQTLALATGKENEYLTSIDGSHALRASWFGSLSLPYYYGAALPAVYPLTRYPSFVSARNLDEVA